MISLLNSNLIMSNPKSRKISSEQNKTKMKTNHIVCDSFNSSVKSIKPISFKSILSRNELDKIYNKGDVNDLADDIKIEDFCKLFRIDAERKKVIQRYYYDDKFRIILEKLSADDKLPNFLDNVINTEKNIIGTFEYWCMRENEIKNENGLINTLTSKKNKLFISKLFHPSGLIAFDPNSKASYFDKLNSEYIGEHLKFFNHMTKRKENLLYSDIPYDQVYARRTSQEDLISLNAIEKYDKTPILFNKQFKEVGDFRLYNELCLYPGTTFSDITQRQMYDFLEKIKALAKKTPQNVIYLKQNMNKAFDSYSKKTASIFPAVLTFAPVLAAATIPIFGPVVAPIVFLKLLKKLK